MPRVLPVLVLQAAVLLGASCSAPPSLRDDRPPADGDEEATPAAAKASGASPYTPAPSKLPDGAIERALLERVIAAGPGWLLSQVPLQPTFGAKRKFAGFQIVSLFRNDPKVLRYGVQPGDVVRAINGQRLVTPGDLLLVFERLKTADVLEVQVSRNGTELAYRWPILPNLPIPPAPPLPAPEAPAATTTTGTGP